MPILKESLVLELARSIRAFLYLEVGLTRDGSQDPSLARSRPRATGRDRDRAGLKESDSGGSRGELAGYRGRSDRLRPGNIIWICGTGRTGSTWLMNMMKAMPLTSAWNEPRIGRMFGDFYGKAQSGQRNTRKFVLGEPARAGWIPLVRDFVLGSVDYRYPHLGHRNYLVVKEPNASLGAQFLVEALPESRFVLLIRDPRDVISSYLDAMREGSWAYRRRDLGKRGQGSLVDSDPDVVVEKRAKNCLKEVSYAKEAYDSHGGPKALVRYEDLRSDAFGTMKRLYSELEVPVDEGRLRRVVEEHSWERIPEGEKGEGKVFRKARPGGWQEDLTAEQARIVEEITAPLLKVFYSR